MRRSLRQFNALLAGRAREVMLSCCGAAQHHHVPLLRCHITGDQASVLPTSTCGSRSPSLAPGTRTRLPGTGRDAATTAVTVPGQGGAQQARVVSGCGTFLC
jgi:hypothetical protein